MPDNDAESTAQNDERPPTEVNERSPHDAAESIRSEREIKKVAQRNHEHMPTQSELIEKSIREYLDLGWSVLPLRSRKKEPARKAWNDEQLELSGILAEIKRGHDNLGVLLGRPGSWLVDVDLDSRFARAANERAPELLDRSASFGHSGEITHVLVTIPDTAIKRELFKDPSDNSILLEVRGTGHQTMVPLSIHPNGERLTWRTPPKELITLGEESFINRVRLLAAMALLVKHMPGEGSRDEVALWLSGAMLSNGWPASRAEQFIRVVFDLGGALDVEAKVRKVGQTAKVLGKEHLVGGLGKLRECLPPKVADRLGEWMGFQTAPAAASTRRTGQSAKDLLVEIGSSVPLWRDSLSGELYASALIAGRTEHVSTRSRAFKRYLANQFHERQHTVPEDAAVKNALTVLEGKAQNGPAFATGRRVMRRGCELLLDLANEAGQVVVISSEGWRVEVASSDVRFIRASDSLPLPAPQRGGSIEQLRPFLNTDGDGFILLVGVLLCWCRPHGPYPIVALQGEAGSGKSGCLDILRLLVDPARAMRSAPPRSEDDLVVTAAGQHVQSFDNVSSIQQHMYDALCRLATGGGLKKRQLYSDGEVFTLDVQRPVVMTAITLPDHVPDDFKSRLIAIDLERIVAEYRREAEIRGEFDALRPLILGSLLDGVVVALQRATEDLSGFAAAFRLSDAIHWVEQAAPAFGWEAGQFTAAYSRMRERLYEETADANPLVDLLSRWVQAQKVVGARDTDEARDTGKVYDGSAKELLAQLNLFAASAHALESLLDERRRPLQPKGLARKMHLLAESLRQVGVSCRAIKSGASNTVWVIERTKLDLIYDPRTPAELPF